MSELLRVGFGKEELGPQAQAPLEPPGPLETTAVAAGRCSLRERESTAKAVAAARSLVTAVVVGTELAANVSKELASGGDGRESIGRHARPDQW